MIRYEALQAQQKKKKRNESEVGEIQKKIGENSTGYEETSGEDGEKLQKAWMTAKGRKREMGKGTRETRKQRSESDTTKNKEMQQK